MVRALHEAGIEVILNVVYNHTAEGGHLGPTLSLRGIDNAAYYRLVDSDPRLYLDTTGTGNSLLVRHPHVLQMIMDSLRYWVTEMHVDGFRFDLAAALARQFARGGPPIGVLQPGPAGSCGVPVKLIEPWDVGEGDYGRQFPSAVEQLERQVPGHVAGFLARPARHAGRVRVPADRLRDLAGNTGPVASVNLITCPDHFTLHNLVSYDHKHHNEANGEANTGRR